MSLASFKLLSIRSIFRCLWVSEFVRRPFKWIPGFLVALNFTWRESPVCWVGQGLKNSPILHLGVCLPTPAMLVGGLHTRIVAALALKPHSSLSPQMSLAPFELLSLCWSLEWVWVSLCMGPLSRRLGFQQSSFSLGRDRIPIDFHSQLLWGLISIGALSWGFWCGAGTPRSSWGNLCSWAIILDSLAITCGCRSSTFWVSTFPTGFHVASFLYL